MKVDQSIAYKHPLVYCVFAFVLQTFLIIIRFKRYFSLVSVSSDMYKKNNFIPDAYIEFFNSHVKNTICEQ